MPSLTYELYDVFTDTPFNGNPLAVFLDGQGISSELMARIANELNLSETVFVTRLEGDTAFRLRIFTPQSELPFAGHPTIGAACALRDASLAADVVEFDLAAGTVRVELGESHANFAAPMRPTSIKMKLDNAAGAALLGLPDHQVLRVRGADAGVPFALIELASRAALRDARLALAEWRRNWAESPTPHIYVYYRSGDCAIDARMFAPAMGIQEDPATGGAAAALAACLADGTYRITQGEDMGRHSSIELRVSDGPPIIGGTAIRIGTGQLFNRIQDV